MMAGGGAVRGADAGDAPELKLSDPRWCSCLSGLLFTPLFLHLKQYSVFCVSVLAARLMLLSSSAAFRLGDQIR